MDTRRSYTQVSIKQRVIAVTMLWVGVERRAQAAPSMEAHGRRERLWRCTEERCVARIHRGDSNCANDIDQTQKQQTESWKARV